MTLLPASSNRGRAAGLGIALLLGTAVVIAYAAGLRGPFLMDDFDAIFPLAAAWSSGMDGWEVLRTAPSHIRDRALANLSFLMSHALAGGGMPPSAFAFKLGNLFVHLACGLACYLLAARLAVTAGADGLRARRAGWLVAAVFLLHPLLVSTVLYPVQRMAQLSTLFVLLAVFVYVGWRRTLGEASTARHAASIALVGVLMLLAVLGKESGALAPLLILVVEITCFRWPPRNTGARSRFESGFGLLCAGPLLLGSIALGLRWEGLLAGYAQREFSLVERLLTELHVVASYLGQIVWPRIGGMGLYHDDFPITSAPDAATLVLGLLFAAAIGIALWLRRRWPSLALGVLWFFAAHALESTIIPLELVFEHRNYLALFGPAFALAWLVSSLRSAAAFATVALLITTVLGVQTGRRASDWASYEVWITAEASNHPESLRAGTDLFLHQVASGRMEDAIATRARLELAHPQHVQPVLLKLAFACPGPIRIELFSAIERETLRTGRMGKDAFHAYRGLRDQIQGRCPNPDWSAFALASRRISENDIAKRTPRAEAAWLRLNADAQLRLAQWTGVAQTMQQVLRLDASDPRDWLLFAEAAARTGEFEAYASARARVIGLLGGRPGSLATEIDRIDALAASERARRSSPATSQP